MLARCKVFDATKANVAARSVGCVTDPCRDPVAVAVGIVAEIGTAALHSTIAEWWACGFRSWKQRNDANAVLNFLCELGPREYAITGVDGEELSDRWEEALIIRDRVRRIWATM